MQVPLWFGLAAEANGSAVQCPQNYCGARTATMPDGTRMVVSPFQAYADGTSGYGYWEWQVGGVGSILVNDDGTPSNPNEDPNEEREGKWVYRVIPAKETSSWHPVLQDQPPPLKMKIPKGIITAIRNEVVKQVKNCANKIEQLIREAERRVEGTDQEEKAESYDVLKIFDKVVDQQGFYYTDGKNQARGSVGGGNAEIWLTHGTKRFSISWFAMIVIGELPHVAGNKDVQLTESRGAFSDYGLGNAAYNLDYGKPPRDNKRELGSREIDRYDPNGLPDDIDPMKDKKNNLWSKYYHWSMQDVICWK